MIRNSEIKAPRSAVVIGCGKSREGKEGWAIGHSHAAGYLAADPGIHLYGVDIDIENLAAFGQAFGIPEERLFASTEALYATLVPAFASICTWPRLHAAQVIDAANRGVRGILCEKPLALDLGEIRRMVAACAERDVKLAVAHQRRLDPVFLRCREIAASGELGEQLVFEGRVGDGWDILSWTTHLFDMANFFFDSLPETVLAGIDHCGGRRYGHAVENESVVFAEYPGRRQAIFITGPDALGGALIRVKGTDGMATIEDRRLRVWSQAGYREEVIPSIETVMAPPIRELIAAVETGSAMTCSVEACAAATEIAYAAHESARTMQKTSLPVSFEFAPLEVVQAAPEAWLPEGDIILFADTHFDGGGREGIAEAIHARTGRSPVIVDPCLSGLNRESLSTAGLVIIYHTQAEPDQETRAALMEWVTTGKPLAIIHAGLGAYPHWEEYTTWCGRIWCWDPVSPSEHPHEESLLLVGSQLSLAWREARLPRDEVFIKLKETAPCIDHAEVAISSGKYPAAWTHGRFPNVGVWVPGHRRDLWSVPAVREGLLAVLQTISSKPNAL
jgi:predicted dehydrogenase